MIGANWRVCTIVVLAALITATTWLPSTPPVRGGFPVQASAVADLPPAGGTTAGAVAVGGDATIHTTMKTETFSSNVFTATGCPGSWQLYPTPNNWVVAGGVANASSGTGGVGGRLDQAENGNPCATAGLSPAYTYAMKANFSVRKLGGDNMGWYIGYTAYKTLLSVQLCGPQVYVMANPVGTPANVSWRLYVFDGTSTAVSSASKWNSLRLYSWYSLTLQYSNGVASATINGSTLSLAGSWTNCLGGSNGGVAGTSLTQAVSANTLSSNAINVDDMTVRWPAEGTWTSAPVTVGRIQSVAFSHLIAQLASGASTGFLCGSCYMNTTSPAWTKTTQITTSGSTYQADVLDDTQATSGSVSALAPPWTLSLRLNSTVGFVPVSISGLQLTYTVQPPGGGPPPNPTPTYCDQNPLAPSCLQNQTVVQKVIAQVCNLWALIFALLLVAVAVWVRRAARHGPGPAPRKGIR